MVLAQEDLLVLRQLLPPEIWQHREAFFQEGMRMEIGPCHRRYETASFYAAATAKHADTAKIDKHGNLKGYRAGLPFSPEKIDGLAADAAIRWAWNFAKRYRGAGWEGKFRLTDFPSRLGGIQTYRGEMFFLQTSGRSDLPDGDYELDVAHKKIWASGGAFTHPFNARHIAWRQFRPLKAMKRHEESDDVFVYVPTMRKVRRSATSWVDGLYFPKYTRGGDSGGGSIPLGGGGSISPTAGESVAVTEHMKRGLMGLETRPNAYVWRYLGERNVLAPLNVVESGYPIDPDRNYGSSGLSLASDRWDVRHAVVIEGAAKVNAVDIRTVTIYLDAQTQQPLYWVTRTGRRRLLDIGILAHRYSSETPGYPLWDEEGRAANVFAPVAATFFDAASGRGGWRRESFDLMSVPFSQTRRRDMTSSDSLVHGK